jgi:hypothetical protein
MPPGEAGPDRGTGQGSWIAGTATPTRLIVLRQHKSAAAVADRFGCQFAYAGQEFGRHPESSMPGAGAASP